MMKRTFSLLLTLCLLLASIPMVQATECPNGGVHEITADGTYTVTISEPTCTEAGVAVYTCTRCGLIEVDEEEKAAAEATPIPDAYGTVNEGGDLTDLTLTSAIKQAGGGYSFRREEATLESITLASEKDPENAWMRLTASEPAKQLGMQASYIGNQITLTLTENDQELTITEVVACVPRL